MAKASPNQKLAAAAVASFRHGNTADLRSRLRRSSHTRRPPKFLPRTLNHVRHTISPGQNSLTFTLRPRKPTAKYSRDLTYSPQTTCKVSIHPFISRVSAILTCNPVERCPVTCVRQELSRLFRSLQDSIAIRNHFRPKQITRMVRRPPSFRILEIEKGATVS
jgi:hypothetical protein